MKKIALCSLFICLLGTMNCIFGCADSNANDKRAKFPYSTESTNERIYPKATLTTKHGTLCGYIYEYENKTIIINLDGGLYVENKDSI